MRATIVSDTCPKTRRDEREKFRVYAYPMRALFVLFIQVGVVSLMVNVPSDALNDSATDERITKQMITSGVARKAYGSTD